MKNIIKGEKHDAVSVWLITRDSPKKVLLLHHKKYNSWIQPGGHREHFENPIETAIREVNEETGIDISFLEHSISPADDLAVYLPVPQFLLEERIQAFGDQPEHFHLDHMYMIEVDEQDLTLNERESHSIGWFTMEEALKLPMFENTKVIIEKLLQ